MATLFRAGLLIPPLLSSRLSESASDAVFDLIDALNSAISFVPRIFRDPVHIHPELLVPDRLLDLELTRCLSERMRC